MHFKFSCTIFVFNANLKQISCLFIRYAILTTSLYNYSVFLRTRIRKKKREKKKLFLLDMSDWSNSNETPRPFVNNTWILTTETGLCLVKRNKILIYIFFERNNFNGFGSFQFVHIFCVSFYRSDILCSSHELQKKAIKIMYNYLLERKCKLNLIYKSLCIINVLFS